MDAGSEGILIYEELRIEYPGKISVTNASKPSARLSTLYIGSTEISGLCIAARVMCDPLRSVAGRFRNGLTGFKTGQRLGIWS